MIHPEQGKLQSKTLLKPASLILLPVALQPGSVSK
jgi:hypothetical protein